MSLPEDIRALAVEASRAFGGAKDEASLEEARVRYLGRKGGLRSLAKRLREADPSERAEAGKALNDVKKQLESAFQKRKGEVPLGPLFDERKEPTEEDLSLPGERPRLGHIPPITRTVRELVAVFERLGFSVAEGPEVETEWHNFTALNIPAEHPSHDPFDTFYLEGGRLLRSPAAPVRIRVMQKTPPPVRVVVPGRVFRPDKVDATHYHTFHQLEGLAVEEGISFADLKACLTMFAKGVFGEEVRTRFRPSFFPFTEPSAEVDISCIFCKGKGCRVCKDTGWIEILGAGMVHPAVFEQVGYDAEKYTGFAFGMGVERVAMLKWGINDIRLFVSAERGNDVRFLRQF